MWQRWFAGGRSSDAPRLLSVAAAVMVAVVVMVVVVVVVPLGMLEASAADARVTDPAATGEREPGSHEAQRLLADQSLVMMRTTLGAAADRADDADSRARSRLRPDQLERARVLLDLALALQPDDAEAWRLRAELAEHLDDAPTQRAALSRYVRLRPADDAAQLALMRSHLGAIQTLEGRLDRIEAIVQSPQGQRFSAPLRSRLATDAAAAAYEMARSDQVASWLREAITLDPANPEAAAMAYDVALSRGTGMLQLGTAAIQHVVAAPADPDVRLALAEVLLSQALYSLAAQQYEAAGALSVHPLPAAVHAHHALCLAARGEDRRALALLDRLVPPHDDEAGDGPANGAVDHARAQAAGQMAVERELLRLAILDTAPANQQANQPANQGDAAAQAFDRLQRWLARRIERAEEASEEAQAMADLAWAKLLFDREVDAAAVLVEDLDTRLAQIDQTARHRADELAMRMPRLRAWLALRRGEAEAAAAAFEEQGQDDPFAALGQAELVADADRRHRWLIEALHQAPGSLAGLLAARRLQHEEQPVVPTRSGHALASVMDRQPSQLWRPTLIAAPWVELHLDVEPMAATYLDPLRVTLTLRNASPVALPMMDGAGVPMRVLLTVSPVIGGQRVARPAPMVVDVGRRLVLEPRQTLTVEARLDRGQLGAMLAQLPDREVNLDVTAILGPLPTAAGGFATGPMGRTATVRAVAVRGEAVDEARLERWIEALNVDAHAHLPVRMHAIARLTRVYGSLPAPLDDDATRARIAGAINTAAARLDPMAMAWLARFLPPDAQAKRAFDSAIEHIERSDEPIVRIVHLASHVSDADDALLEASLDHRDSTIRAFSTALRDSLRARSARDEQSASGRPEQGQEREREQEHE